MPPPEHSGLHHLRQRWAQENFGDGVESALRPKPNNDLSATDHSSTTDTALTDIVAPQSYQHHHEGSGQRSNNAASPRPKHMRSWKDLLSPMRASFWSRSDGQLAEVNAQPPFPPARSTEDEESTVANIPVRRGKGVVHKAPSSSVTTIPFWLTEIYTLSWLVFFSILGALARLGIEAITQYPGAPVTSRVLWANIGGSFVMGFLIEDRRLFKQPTTTKGDTHKILPEKGHAELKAEHLKFKKTVPLYIGLSTGFCGSFTSFSSFVRDAFLALTNDLETPSASIPYHASTPVYPRNGGFSFLALLAILIIHPALSLVALWVGAQFALLITPITPRVPAGFLNKFLNPFIVFVSLASWLGVALALSISPPYPDAVVAWRSRALFPMLFAPPGCLLRYWLSKYLNGIRPSFPLGTFSANILATAVLGMCWDLQHATSIRSGNACAVLLGVMEGFCGCLSTVSTWVVELDGLERRKAWIYGVVSTGVGLGFLVCIMGGMGWTVGFAPATCG